MVRLYCADLSRCLKQEWSMSKGIICIPYDYLLSLEERRNVAMPSEPFILSLETQVKLYTNYEIKNLTKSLGKQYCNNCRLI